MFDFCFQTTLLQLYVVWLSWTQGAHVPRGQRSAFVPGPPGPTEGFDAIFGSSLSSPSAPSSLHPNFGPAGFDAYNPGAVALPPTGYPFVHPAAGFDFAGIQLQSLLAAPSSDLRFPGFGFNVAGGYPLAVPPPRPYPNAAGDDLQHLRTLAAAGVRFDQVPKEFPVGVGSTQSLRPVPVFVGQSAATIQTQARPAPQTNDAYAQSVTPNAAVKRPNGSNDGPPRPHYNQVGTASSTAFKVSPAANRPQQPQPIRTGNDLIATSAPPSSGSLPVAEPVSNLALELRPPPYANTPNANPDSSFYSPAKVPSPQPSYPSFLAEPINGPGSASGAFSGLPAGDPSVRESYSTTPRGLTPDAYPTPSVSYSLPSKSFRLPAGSADAYGSNNAPNHPMSPIVVVPDNSYPADTSGLVSGGQDTGSSSSSAGAGHYNAVPVLANVYGSSNPISANTYSDSNAIQGSSYSNAAGGGTLTVNPKPIAGTFFDDSNSISSPQPPPSQYQPNGTK